MGAPATRLINRGNAVTEHRIDVFHLALRLASLLPWVSCKAEVPVRVAQNGLAEHHGHGAVAASCRWVGIGLADAEQRSPTSEVVATVSLASSDIP